MMKATVSYSGAMPLQGRDSEGRLTVFDTTPEFHGTGMASSPVTVLLESLAACSMIDVISILGKQRFEIASLNVTLKAERADTHPKVFTAISIHYELSSPDCTPAAFERSVELSIDKYCSVAAMLRNSGCSITWTTTIT
jgi:putative redox protein